LSTLVDLFSLSSPYIQRYLYIHSVYLKKGPWCERLILIPAFAFSLIFAYHPCEASSKVQLSTGETVYVSIYSTVDSASKKLPFHLAAMLMVRNTDPKYPITILKADYYENDGTMIESYIKEQVD
jgi:hypothetical protein